jgi:hypothetical protein
VLARGNVTIEAWNTDFNCSKLVSQWHDGVINNLACNGTGNGTDESSPRPSATPSPTTASNSPLSSGALAGIGVGSTLFVVGVVLAIGWLAFRYKRLLHNMQEVRAQGLGTGTKEPEGDTAPLGVGGLHEADGTGIIREKPDDPLTELPVQEAELGTNSP